MVSQLDVIKIKTVPFLSRSEYLIFFQMKFHYLLYLTHFHVAIKMFEIQLPTWTQRMFYV